MGGAAKKNNGPPQKTKQVVGWGEVQQRYGGPAPGFFPPPSPPPAVGVGAGGGRPKHRWARPHFTLTVLLRCCVLQTLSGTRPRRR